jgi:hypothetical protein
MGLFSIAVVCKMVNLQLQLLSISIFQWDLGYIQFSLPLLVLKISEAALSLLCEEPSWVTISTLYQVYGVSPWMSIWVLRNMRFFSVPLRYITRCVIWLEAEAEVGSFHVTLAEVNDGWILMSCTGAGIWANKISHNLARNSTCYWCILVWTEILKFWTAYN